jgi:hypothetical protein
MDTVLDRNGKEFEVRGINFPAYMWVVETSDCTPVACIAKGANDLVEWEDYKGTLDKVRFYKEGDSVEWADKGKVLRIIGYNADFSAVMSGDKVLTCSALRGEELVCGWTNPDFRGSSTLFAYAIHLSAYLLQSKGIDKIYWTVSVDNTRGNKHQWGRNVSVVEVNGRKFNRYESSVVDCVKLAKDLQYIWRKNGERENEIKDYLREYSLV